MGTNRADSVAAKASRIAAEPAAALVAAFSRTLAAALTLSLAAALPLTRAAALTLTRAAALTLTRATALTLSHAAALTLTRATALPLTLAAALALIPALPADAQNADAYRARLERAISEYRTVESTGGWPQVPYRSVMQRGDTSDAVGVLRHRLRATNDLADSSASTAFDDALHDAVVAFQERHGLEIDGIVGPRTIEALNVPVSRRIMQLQANLPRAPADDPAFIEINIPAFELRVVENGRVTLQMKTIVGKRSTPTPLFDSYVEEVVLAPYWTVPRSIEVNEILPKLRTDPGYLRRHSMGRMANGMLRQDPGPGNPLGRIKFIIPNAYGVGLHDTNERYLFTRTVCAFSHGCMRVERPEDLALFLLDGTAWTRERLNAVIETWTETRIPVERVVPVHVIYRTAWVDDRGRVHFRDDVYRRER